MARRADSSNRPVQGKYLHAFARRVAKMGNLS
jgi:hypothetical protein